jgi:hypothetical protein
MKTWPVQDAEARFSELLEAGLAERRQVATRRGDLRIPARGRWQRPRVLRRDLHRRI